jgi:hypothetical protein
MTAISKGAVIFIIARQKPYESIFNGNIYIKTYVSSCLNDWLSQEKSAFATIEIASASFLL